MRTLSTPRDNGVSTAVAAAVPIAVVPVRAHGRVIGNLMCVPVPGAGVPADHRRLAVALSDVFGLAMGSTPAAA